jgi:Winged helix DNA-binding domain
VAAAAELGWPSALWWRMRRHGLVEREAAGADALVGVASRLCGLHAQVMSSAELTAWARIDGLQNGDVASALWDHGRLVKTWAMRGTLHLLPGDELPLWHAAFSMYEHFLKGAWVRAFGFSSADEVEALIAEIGEALDGRALTREELAEALPHHGDKLRESWGSALKPAAFRGLLAFAPSEGQAVRFTRPPGGAGPPVDEAVAEITRRYLAAYGPARRQDLSRWWGTHALSAAKAQKRFEALGDEVAEVEVDGERCWVLAADLEAILGAEPPRAARLLPLFDQYVVSSNRAVDALLPEAERARVFRQAGWISPVILVDGAIAGVWRHERKGARLVVELEPFGPLPAWARKQVEADAERLAAFVGGSLERAWR